MPSDFVFEVGGVGSYYCAGCAKRIAGTAEIDSRNAGIEAAYNCILRESIVDIERNDEPAVRAQFEKYRPALDLLIKAWPWLYLDPKE